MKKAVLIFFTITMVSSFIASILFALQGQYDRAIYFLLVGHITGNIEI
jgi:hypothetical protein